MAKTSFQASTTTVPPTASSAISLTPSTSRHLPPPSPLPNFIAVDVDGTLLSSSRIVSSRNIAAFKQLKHIGGLPFVATGRSRDGFLQVIPRSVREEMGYPDAYPGVFLNGACVYGPDGKLIYSTSIPSSLYRGALDLLKTLGLFDNCLVECQGRLLCNSLELFPLDIFRSVEGTPVFQALPGEMYQIANCTKICVVVKDEETNSTSDILKKFTDSRLNVLVCFRSLVELNMGGVSKADGIMRLLKVLGGSPDRLMCIGDAENDETMMALAKYSVAVGNATPRCKELAKYHAANCDEDALADAVDKVFGLKV